MSLRAQRLTGLAVAVFLGYFLFQRAHLSWINFWLRTDAQQSIAKVVGDYWGGHGEVGYHYDVNQKHYTGISGTKWRDPHYSDVRPGGEAVVYYSVSHPWLSSLYIPDTVVDALPVLIVVFLFELIAIVTIIRPASA